MATNTYEPGDRVEIRTSTPFASAAGVEFDPDVVTFQVTDPVGTTTAYVSGTDAEVTNPATGDYACTIDVETEGRWYYYIKGETTGGAENRGADQGSFVVASKLTGTPA